MIAKITGDKTFEGDEIPVDPKRPVAIMTVRMLPGTERVLEKTIRSRVGKTFTTLGCLLRTGEDFDEFRDLSPGMNIKRWFSLTDAGELAQTNWPGTENIDAPS